MPLIIEKMNDLDNMHQKTQMENIRDQNKLQNRTKRQQKTETYDNFVYFTYFDIIILAKFWKKWFFMQIF